MKLCFQFLSILVLSLLFYWFLTHQVIMYVVVDGHSMEPTYHNSEVVKMTKLPLWFHGPRKGDVVIIREFDEVGKGDGGIDLKRVAGVKGDIIAITNGGFVIHHRLTKDECYVLGDNTSRGASFDSRCYGPLPLNQVLGVAWQSKQKN
jgi:signal peptidase I